MARGRMLGRNAAFLYTDPTTGQDVVIDLPAPLRDIRTRLVQRRYVEEALDGTRSVKTIGPAHYELIGRIRFVDAPDAVLSMLHAAANGAQLVYTEDVTDPHAKTYAAELIWDDAAIELGMDADLGKIGRGEVTVVLRSSTPWGALYAGPDVLFRYRAGEPLSAAGAAFSRASSAWHISRDGILREAAPNVPRITWEQYAGERRPYLLLEPAATNLLRQSSNVGPDSSPWGGTTEFSSITPAASIAGQTAWRHTNSGLAGSRSRRQTAGQFGSGPQTASVIVENESAGETALNIHDSTAGAAVCIGRLRWATGEASVQSGTGIVHAQKLADAGPNGGPVYLLAVTVTGTPSNGRQIIIYPTGTMPNTDTVIIHHVQLEEQPFHTSPIVTADTPVTRAADVLTFPWAHAPGPMTGYLRFIERGALAYPDTRVLLQIGTGTTQPRLYVRKLTGEGRYGIGLDHAAGASSTLPTSPVPAIGDRVELLWRLYADGSVQIEQSINGGTPTVAARSAAVGLPTEWSGQILRLSGVPSGALEAPAAWRDAVVLRGSDWTMDQIRQRFGIS